MPTKGRKAGTVRFAVKPGSVIKKVCLAGDFNSWRLEAMQKQRNGQFVKEIPLAPGTYQYKFLFDDCWEIDPGNQLTAANQFGTLNSVAVVR